MTSKVNSTKDIVSESVNKTLQPQLQSKSESIQSQVLLKAQEFVNKAFTEQQGIAVQIALTEAASGDNFKKQLTETIERGLRDVWDKQKEVLFKNFVQETLENSRFSRHLAKDVEEALVKDHAVNHIIAGALATAVGQHNSEGNSQTAVLTLLAAMDQNAANKVVNDILRKNIGGGNREAALHSLTATNFADISTIGLDLGEMLENAFAVWDEYCMAGRCGSEQSVSATMAAFLGRGRDLGDRDRKNWIRALSLWHEKLVSDRDAPAREVSLTLVPLGLGAIATPDAIDVLTSWFKAPDTELALSAVTAVGALPSTSFSDSQRLALFQVLWSRILERDGARASLDETAWMALGAVSHGSANAIVGPFHAEAMLIKPQLGATGTRSQLAEWANATPRDERQAPPRTACSVAANPGWVNAASDKPSRLRSDLCALAALLRPLRGKTEWNELRPVLMRREEVASLGALWALAANGIPDYNGSMATLRFAPLSDLLMAQRPSPLEFDLAAMLMLRTVRDSVAWKKIEELGSLPDSPHMLLAATRWVFRPRTDEQAWFIERLGKMSAQLQAQVLGTIYAAAWVGGSERASDRPLADLVRQLNSSRFASNKSGIPSTAYAPTFNLLLLAHAIDPHGLLAAFEGEENALGALSLIADESNPSYSPERQRTTKCLERLAS